MPVDLDVHVVLDNLSAHKAPEIQKWLAHPKRARWHLHFTPTSSSWLNLVEGWFNLLTERRLRRGTFSSVDVLVEGIETWAEHWNDDPQPFVWTKPAKEIIAKVKRGRAALTTRPNPRRTTSVLIRRFARNMGGAGISGRLAAFRVRNDGGAHGGTWSTQGGCRS